MKNLLAYLNGLSRPDQVSFALRCGTTIGYLRKAISIGQELNETITIGVDRESRGEITCESLRPEVDWAYLANRFVWIAKAPAGQMS